jgi:hypothetical protein
VIYSRHWLIGALVLATGLCLGGCQEALTVGAVNRCGAEVEIQLDTVREATTQWITLRDGGGGSVADVGEGAETLYVNVRTPGAAGVRSFEVPTASLEPPPAGVDYEAQLVLKGDRCP